MAYSLATRDVMDTTIYQTMAIVNNLGHIHFITNNLEFSAQCFENLLSTLMFVMDCGDQNMLASEHIDGFLSNVLPLMNSNGCTSAAAA